jgi:anti-sigma regulatory factor (Ser/Thr protein kinase)
METTHRARSAREFCIVLSPDRGAGVRASEAVRERFRTLAEPTRKDLAAVVTELVNYSVEHGPGKPITVTVVLGADSIHGEVADHGNPAVETPPICNGTESDRDGLALVDRLTSRWAVYEGRTDVWFEMPLRA